MIVINHNLDQVVATGDVLVVGVVRHLFGAAQRHVLAQFAKVHRRVQAHPVEPFGDHEPVLRRALFLLHLFSHDPSMKR
ncbi:hypothetical protein D3C86_1896330 [compost metagenome]